MNIAFEDRRPEAAFETVSSDLSEDPCGAFPLHVAVQLLDKLSNDDAFRALFQTNPRAAMRDLGHETPAEHRDVRGADSILCLYGTKQLASKEKIRAARSTLLQQLGGPPIFKLTGLGD